MDVHDGFISGIHSYCDRWCETCGFTSWCRVFAQEVRDEASRDPNLKPVADAPPLPEDEPPETPEWITEMIEEAFTQFSLEPAPPPRADLERRDHPLLKRSRDYFVSVHTWFEEQGVAKQCADPGAPLAVISWFAPLIPAKIGRALSGLAWAEADDPDDPRDYDGSAKVALIGIDRSSAAWMRLAESIPVDASFNVDLLWMREFLERLFPRARTFVRPAFDEPEAVARLLAETR